MGYCMLARHGQAQFGKPIYDHLSPLGFEQSMRLGQGLKKDNWIPDIIVTGNLLRHRQTAETLLSAMGINKEIVIDAAFDEHLGPAVVKEHWTNHINLNQTIKEWLQEDPSLFDQRKIAYLKFYEETTLAWAKGELHSELQNWAEYVDRVVSGLETIYKQSKNQNVLIVTSGGPVSIATGLVKSLSISDIIKLTWEVYNASHTKINFLSKPSLEYYNNVSHFDEDRYVTLV